MTPRIAVPLFLAVGLVLSMPSPPIHAAPTAKPKTLADKLPPEAGKHFRVALAFYDQGSYEAALAEFQVAWQLSGEARVLRNVAVCQKNLKRYARAVATLQRALDEGKSLEPATRKQIEKEIALLLPLTALVKVSVVDGAEVLVDGESLGTAPFLAPLRVDVGERTITVRKAGSVDWTKKVVVGSGTVSDLSVVLEPLVQKGKLVVQPKGPAAKVLVDGVEVGAAPWEGEVVAGKRSVEVRAAGYRPYVTSVDVASKSTITLVPTLTLLGGTLTIRTNVDDARIEIDGKVVGSGGFTGAVSVGGHRLVLTASGKKRYEGEVTVLDGQTRTVTVDLESSNTWLWWVGGGVVLAGASVGGYFLLRPKKTEEGFSGSIGSVALPLRLP